MTLSRRRLRQALVLSTALVSAAGLTVEVLKSIYRWKGRSGVVPLLSLSYEQNVPTFHTAVLLLLCAAASALLASSTPREKRPDALAWWGLSLGFFYISVDEVLSFHETWGASFRLGGALHFGWVIPAAGIVVTLLALYARFLLRLPRRFRNRLLLSGAIYVFGAVVMELPLGYWTEKEGTKNLEYALIDWVEESMEMAGLVLFLLTAFDMLSSAGAVLRFGSPSPEPEAATGAPGADGAAATATGAPGADGATDAATGAPGADGAAGTATGAPGADATADTAAPPANDDGP